jgi:hypothetical protein
MFRCSSFTTKKIARMKKIPSVMLFPVWVVLPALLALHSCNSPDAAEFEKLVISYSATLPDYTEYGYNTAGAHFITTDSKSGTFSYLWVIYYSNMHVTNAYFTKQSSGLFSFSMNGMKAPFAEKVDVSFTFQADVSDSLTDLQKLSNTQYSTQKGNLSADISGSSSMYQGIKIKSASLNFKRSRIIYTDFSNRRRGVSLSGTFELTGVTPDDVNVEMNDGRFDILFSGNNGTSFDNSVKR